MQDSVTNGSCQNGEASLARKKGKIVEKVKAKNKLKKLFYIIIGAIFLAACVNKATVKKAKSFALKMDERFGQFGSINVYMDGDAEVWGTHRKGMDIECFVYYPKRDSVVFDRKTFVFNISNGHIPEDFPYEEVFRKIHKEKKELGIVAVLQQSQQIGACVEFFFTDKDCVIFLEDNFKADDENEKKCLEEFESGTPLMKNWVYKRID